MNESSETVDLGARQEESADAGVLSLVDESNLTALRSEERLALRGGRTIRLSSHGTSDRVTIVGRGGRTELVIELSDAGARVKLESADLDLEALGKMNVSCDEMSVDARRFHVRASEKASIVGADVELRATTGDVRIQANDDIRAKGERILLNSEGTLEVPTWMRQKLDASLGAAPSEVTLPLSNTSGDEELLK